MDEQIQIVQTCDRTANKVEADKCAAFFERIAFEEGWTPPTGELRAYTARSVSFYMLERNQTDSDIMGALQVVLPDEKGLFPFHKVWPELTSLDIERRSAHIAILAVDKDYRAKSGGLFWNLAVEMWRYCVLHGISDLFLETTPRTLTCYRRLGWPLVIRGELRVHWGEPCYLTSMSVREVGGALTERAVRSPLYRSIVLNALRYSDG